MAHRGQAGSHRISTVNKAHARFATVLHGGLTCTMEIRFINAETATVLPRNKPAMYSNPVRPDEPWLCFGSDAGTENCDSVNKALG